MPTVSSPSLSFRSSTCHSTWKLKRRVDEYKEFRGKPLSRISTKVLEYVVKAFFDPRLGKRKHNVFLWSHDRFVLPLVWNVTTDEMLLRQQAVTDMAIVSTRPISQEGRVHLEDQLIQQHLNDLELTTTQPFKKMAAVQESIAGVHGRRLCKLLHQDHFPFVSSGPGAAWERCDPHLSCRRGQHCVQLPGRGRRAKVTGN